MLATSQGTDLGNSREHKDANGVRRINESWIKDKDPSQVESSYS